MADEMGQDHTDTGDGLLRKLAAARGVSTSFRGWDGVEHPVAASTLQGVLAALGDSTGTTDELHNALREAELEEWHRLLPASVVSREGREIHVAVHVPHGRGVTVWAVTEDGNRVDARQRDNWTEPREVHGVLKGQASFALPADLPLGWHTLYADAGGELAECTLVITPERLETTRRLTAERHWGLTAQLYSVRSSRSWGIGDFSDLVDLAAIAGKDGAGFVLVNPLHAGEPRPPIEDSPYLPTTRRFFNPLYIRIEDVPEYGYLDPESRAEIEKNAAVLHVANTADGLLDRNSSYGAKLRALELIFTVPRSPGRVRLFENFCEAEGKGLDDFALWCVLAERLAPSAPEWSGDAASPDTPYCDAVREEQADRLQFYRWMQWICDEQLATAQRTAKACGMAIGVVHDLAVGVKTVGADAWMLQGVLARGVTVGAPPDVFNQQGQNWTQPPWHPGRLAAAGYKPYRDMLRTVLRHAGGIRVDHILGLFRLWWIPEGAGPDQGTYVYYDHEALIGILALEAQRAGATVVGEDLGVFEPWVRDYLTERGILGTSILWFEHGASGPLSPEEYRQQCLTSVNTHDLPPTAGYLAGEHVTLRESLGLLLRPVEEERAQAAAEQEAVLALVRERGLLPGSSGDVQRTVEALYAFTALTPSALLGVALVDAVGETRTQNQPGTDTEHPNWRIPLAGPEGPVLIDDLPRDGRFNSLVGIVREALKTSR